MTCGLVDLVGEEAVRDLVLPPVRAGPAVAREQPVDGAMTSGLDGAGAEGERRRR